MPLSSNPGTREFIEAGYFFELAEGKIKGLLSPLAKGWEDSDVSQANRAIGEIIATCALLANAIDRAKAMRDRIAEHNKQE